MYAVMRIAGNVGGAVARTLLAKASRQANTLLVAPEVRSLRRGPIFFMMRLAFRKADTSEKQ